MVGCGGSKVRRGGSVVSNGAPSQPGHRQDRQVQEQERFCVAWHCVVYTTSGPTRNC